ncbi:TrmH family RNA methyltransferase [Niabella digestorum]|uniref:RNA methyltransferase n=1 Tax=Niabella digestorum TaxID=3117701 RepID=A0ABU7RDJ1_9BACT
MLTKSEAKYIQTLSQKKQRDAESLFVVEGPKIVSEAFAAQNIRIRKIYATEEWLLQNKTAISGREFQLVTDIELKKISQLTTPNQVLALIEKPFHQKFEFKKDHLALVLDGIQDPGNMGTIIRTADWFGIRQIICSTDCADAYGSKVVQATMGSIFRIELLYTDLAAWLQQPSGVKIYGASLNGKPLQTFETLHQGLLVIGNESRGIRENVLPLLHEKITIPKIGAAESLNAAVATGIILSHLT